MPKLFKTDIVSEAELRVYVTDVRPDADLVIFETTDAWAATDQSLWCYTEIPGEADKVVYFTNNQWEADLVVYKTDIQPDAGWQDSTKSNLL
jgi:hypothetical protein